MPKRSAEEKLQYYQNKIRKLERKTYRRRLRCISSPDPEENSSPRESEDFIVANTVTDTEPVVPDETPVEMVITQEVSTDSACGNEPMTLVVPDLDPNILAALGEITDEVPEFGEKIHENLAKIWLPLLKKGMPKESREAIVKNYPIPENCPLLQAPTLNSEIAAAMSESEFSCREIYYFATRK